MKEKPSDDERQRLIEEGKRLKQEIPQLEDSLRSVENEIYELAGKIPNMSHPDVPVGSDKQKAARRRPMRKVTLHHPGGMCQRR